MSLQDNSSQSTSGLVFTNKNRKILLIILGIVILASCICSILCITPFILTTIRVAAEWKPAETVLNDYMRYMAAKDVDSAMALFSPHMQEQTPREYMQNLVDHNNYAMFEGFQNLSIITLTLGTEASPDPIKPQGTTANISGTVTYADGYTGECVAVLEKVDGDWMIYSVTITVPQKKSVP